MAQLIEKTSNLDQSLFINQVRLAIQKASKVSVSLADIRNYLKDRVIYNDLELGEALSALISKNVIKPTLKITPDGDAFTVLFKMVSPEESPAK